MVIAGCTPVGLGHSYDDSYDNVEPAEVKDAVVTQDATPWLTDIICSQDLFASFCKKPAYVGIVSPEDGTTVNTPFVPVSVQTQGLFIKELETYPIYFRVNGNDIAKSEKCLPSGAIADIPLQIGANEIEAQYPLYADNFLNFAGMTEETITVYYDPSFSYANKGIIYQVTSPEDSKKIGIVMIDPISGKTIGKFFPEVPKLESFSIFDEDCLLISSDSKNLYYIRRGGGALISTDTNKTIATFSIPEKTAPEDCALSPDGKKLYITAHSEPDFEHDDIEALGPELLVVDLESQTVEQSIPLNAPWYMGTAIDVHPLNGNLYIAVEDQVSVIEPETLEQLDAFLISSWSHPGPIKISPDGVWGIAAGSTDDGSDITVFNAEKNGVIGYFHFPAATSVRINGIAFSPASNPAFLGDVFLASYDYSNETITTLTIPFKEAGERVLTVPQDHGFSLFASSLSDSEETICANLVEINPADGIIKRALYGDWAFGRIVYKKPY